MRLAEARANHDIGFPRQNGRQEFRNFLREMLPVAVALHGKIISIALREFEASLHRAADAQITRQIHDERQAGRFRRFAGMIFRAVIDNHDIPCRVLMMQRF